jgi:hypothetical protein
MDYTMSPEPDDPLRKQAWDYFALHAQQRLTTLNFYVVLSSALTAAIVASFQKDFKFPLLRGVAGFLLAVFSYAFWRLDVRNRWFIKRAEAALSAFELGHRQDDWSSPHLPVEFLFSDERRHEKRRNDSKGTVRQLLVPQSYSDVFNMLFWLFGVAGFISLCSSL